MSTEASNGPENEGYKWILNEVFGENTIDLPLPPGIPDGQPSEPAPNEHSPQNPAWTKATKCARCGRIRDESKFLFLQPPWNVASYEIMVCVYCCWHIMKWVLEQMERPKPVRRARKAPEGT